MQVTPAPRTRATLLLATLLVCATSACASAGNAATADKVSPKAAQTFEEHSAKQEQLTAALEDARTELKLAQLEVAADALEANEDLEDARRELDEAGLALKNFQDVEMPTEIADGQLGIERGMQSLSESRQELAQMEAMYAAEPNLDATGVATRDMVLERHRKRVEFSTRSLELARTRFQDEVGSKLPRQQRKLETELRDAQRGVRKAEHAQEKGAIEGRRSIAKAERAVKEAERKLKAFDAGQGDKDEDAE